MADLSQLTKNIDEYDFILPLGRKSVKIKPPIKKVLQFRLALNQIQENNTRLDQPVVWGLAAPFLGASFDPETYEFSALDDGWEHDGLLLKLIEGGLDFNALDLALNAVYVKYQFGDDVSEELIATGDMGKALQNLRKKNEDNPTPETQKEPGETDETD